MHELVESALSECTHTESTEVLIKALCSQLLPRKNKKIEKGQITALFSAARTAFFRCSWISALQALSSQNLKLGQELPLPDPMTGCPMFGLSLSYTLGFFSFEAFRFELRILQAFLVLQFANSLS